MQNELSFSGSLSFHSHAYSTDTHALHSEYCVSAVSDLFFSNIVDIASYQWLKPPLLAIKWCFGISIGGLECDA